MKTEQFKPRLRCRPGETVDEAIDRWRAERIYREAKSWRCQLAESFWADDAPAQEKESSK